MFSLWSLVFSSLDNSLATLTPFCLIAEIVSQMVSVRSQVNATWQSLLLSHDIITFPSLYFFVMYYLLWILRILRRIHLNMIIGFFFHIVGSKSLVSDYVREREERRKRMIKRVKIIGGDSKYGNVSPRGNLQSYNGHVMVMWWEVMTISDNFVSSTQTDERWKVAGCKAVSHYNSVFYAFYLELALLSHSPCGFSLLSPSLSLHPNGFLAPSNGRDQHNVELCRITAIRDMKAFWVWIGTYE